MSTGVFLTLSTSVASTLLQSLLMPPLLILTCLLQRQNPIVILKLSPSRKQCIGIQLRWGELLFVLFVHQGSVETIFFLLFEMATLTNIFFFRMEWILLLQNCKFYEM